MGREINIHSIRTSKKQIEEGRGDAIKLKRAWNSIGPHGISRIVAGGDSGETEKALVWDVDEQGVPWRALSR